MGNIWVISSGAYVQKRRNVQDFIIDFSICILLNVGRRQNQSNARAFLVDLIICSWVNVAYMYRRKVMCGVF